MSNAPDWFRDINCAITVCDKDGIITYMNQKATRTFEKWGGSALIGKSLFDCHTGRSVALIGNLMSQGGTNTYSIEKNGIKKLIHQTPWYNHGQVAGLIEFSIEIPLEMPHFDRNA